MGLEAMSAGVAVVTSSTGGVREYANSENALLVPIGDEAALVKSLLQIIDDSELRSRLTQAGRQTATAMDWDKITADYEKYFEDLLRLGLRPEDEIVALQAEKTFFVEEFLRNGVQENLVLQAFSLLQQELDKTFIPASAEEVFLRAKRKDLLENLPRFPAGISLLSFYGTVSEAIARASQHKISASRVRPEGGSFVAQIESIVPKYTQERAE